MSVATSSEPRPLASSTARDGQVIALICAAHFVSHYVILLLPPVLESVRSEYGVSYIEIGLALTAFNVVSAAFQTPAGFLVDRVGPRAILTAGLVLGAAAITAAATLPGYWVLVAAFAALGLANTVYHPCDYSILSATVSPNRIGRAFSIHTFSGYLGSGVAPACVLACAALWGWRGAFLAAAALSLAAALLFVVFGGILEKRPASAAAPAAAAMTAKVEDDPSSNGWRLLFSSAILRNLMFFALLALSNGGLQTYAVVALGAVHGTAASVANVALSGFLLLSAFGVLLGGYIADRTTRHERVAAAGFAATSTMVVLIGWVDLGAVALVLAMSLGGMMNGMIQPQRDMIVRSVTPPGSFGKVFGFVSTGFNIGGMISPTLYGWLMDRGEPRMVFAVVAGFILLALVTVITRPKPVRPAA